MNVQHWWSDHLQRRFFHVESLWIDAGPSPWRGRLLPAWAVTWAVLDILAWLRATIFVIYISQIKSNFTAFVCSVFSFMLISLPVSPVWNTLYCQMCLYDCYCRLSVSAFSYWGVDPSTSISDCYLWFEFVLTCSNWSTIFFSSILKFDFPLSQFLQPHV